ncbi:MAG: MurR/RpiR family transcriptional regulator, partial [Acidimicrobiia bacterium]
MDISGQIDAARTQLTPAERRVAAVVVDDPEAVAFGTVADVARRAGASGATVMRLAARLGYGGYLELQGAVRGELTRRLRPASERIRRPPAGGGDLVSRALGCELGNVAASLE